MRQSSAEVDEVLEAIAALVLANQLHDLKEQIVAAIDDLNTAVTGLSTEVQAVAAAVGSQSNNDAAITAAVTAINQATTDLAAAVAALTTPGV